MTTLETKADAEALINKEGIEYVSVRFTGRNSRPYAEYS